MPEHEPETRPLRGQAKAVSVRSHSGDVTHRTRQDRRPRRVQPMTSEPFQLIIEWEGRGGAASAPLAVLSGSTTFRTRCPGKTETRTVAPIAKPARSSQRPCRCRNGIGGGSRRTAHRIVRDSGRCARTVRCRESAEDPGRGVGEGGEESAGRRGVDFRVAMVVCPYQRAVVRRPAVAQTPPGAAVSEVRLNSKCTTQSMLLENTVV